MPPQCCIDQDVQIKTMTVHVHMRVHKLKLASLAIWPPPHTHPPLDPLVPALSLCLLPPQQPPYSLEQPLTQSEFYAASWEVVNSPSTSVTKWGPIEDWDTSGVTTFANAFTKYRNKAGEYNGYTGNSKAETFNGDISKWITSSVKSLGSTFREAAAFNGDISKWITSSVTSLYRTFYGAAAFNSDVSKWITSSVISLSSTFYRAAAFNGDISKWITSSITEMGSTFNYAVAFNGDISKWITSSVTSLYGTFYKAAAFNGTGVDLWNINKVMVMKYIFKDATALTSCNKRKIADAWKSSAVFTATTYDTDWAADTCTTLLPVIVVVVILIIAAV